MGWLMGVVGRRKRSGESCVGAHRENGVLVGFVDARRDRVPPPVVVAWLELDFPNQAHTSGL
jgi:hypothetical protein